MEELIIEAGRTERHYWRDLWRYRELFYFLAWRDILIRYKQTVVGVSWSIIRPLLTMAVLTIVFGRVGRMPSGGVPYVAACLLRHDPVAVLLDRPIGERREPRS